jgi:predicted ABC-type ATPase
MITAEKCRLHAAECKILASSIYIPTQHSLEQSIMALNWEALAEQIDHDDSQAAEARAIAEARATEARLVALFAGVFRPLMA